MGGFLSCGTMCTGGEGCLSREGFLLTKKGTFLWTGLPCVKIPRSIGRGAAAHRLLLASRGQAVVVKGSLLWSSVFAHIVGVELRIWASLCTKKYATCGTGAA